MLSTERRWWNKRGAQVRNGFSPSSELRTPKPGERRRSPPGLV